VAVRQHIEMLLNRGRTFSPRTSFARLAGSLVLLIELAIPALFTPRIVFAQHGGNQAFEVASIKPGDPRDDKFNVQIGNNGITAANITLKDLIGFVYGVRDYQISGGPKWLDAAKFTIHAKVGAAAPLPPGAVGLSRVAPMLRSLLEERFKLAVHPEMKEGSVYELVVAKDGPKLKSAAESGFVRRSKAEITVMGAPVAVFARTLEGALDRPVIDATGLNGVYDFLLTFTPEEPEIIGDPNRPSVFTAIQEQLGLRLQPARGAVGMIVIDHAERPDAN
jgi:uncharacterized protein (TIGR03435 family)